MKRYIIERGWVHLLLLAGAVIFLFPFVYMTATSLKTDEELTSTSWFPVMPEFQPISPRVRVADAVVQPAEMTTEKWAAALPRFRELARAATNAAKLPAGAESVDESVYRTQTAEWIVGRIVSRLNAEVWAGDVDKCVAAFKAALTSDTIAEALDDRLARLEIRGLQVRSLDAHMFNVSPGEKVASAWKVESGNAQFVQTSDAAILKYGFSSASDKPIVLRCDFDFPVDAKNLHKLIFSVKPDDSWHQVDATFDLDGVHWVSDRTKYLGTTRNQSILYQPPSFDDTTDRKRIWVGLRREGVGSGVSGLGTETKGLNPTPHTPNPSCAIFRLTITPSSTMGAIFGKVIRNYERVFDSIPFWRYVRNSMVLVLLTTLGTLFSSSFVAYAFARLNWPGRSVAFAMLLATMMLPAQVTMIPGFMIWRGAGLYNTLCPLWLPAWFGSAFFIFLMVQHMRTIPRELEEAARIDGASVLRTWWQIIVPETKPAMAAIAIMTSMAAWNEFMGPLIYLRDQAKFPLSLGLYAMRLDAPEGGIDWTLIMSGNVLMTIPVLIIFFLFQRYFIQGMTMSGMKG